MKMLIKNGTVYQAGKFTDEDILIENGKIKALGKDLADLTDNIDETVDASGLLVAPGLVDVHVHYREPGFTYKETKIGRAHV